MATKTKKARALIDIVANGITCKCGDVFEADPKLVKSMIDSGIADDHEDAVASGLENNPEVSTPVLEDEIIADIAAATDTINESTAALQDALDKT